MKSQIFLFSLLFSTFSVLFAQEKLLINAYNRESKTLNGKWNYIVDPYENGYYNYRYEPFDKQENPGNGAFFVNEKIQF